MKKCPRVLVPLDFSEASLRALDLALDTPGFAGADFLLVHVIELSVVEAGMNIPWLDVPQARDKLKEAAAGRGLFRPGREAPRLLVAVAGRPADQILKVAESEGVDLIVMSTNGRRGLKRWALGSVAEEVVRRAPCPVLTCGPKAPVTAGAAPTI